MTREANHVECRPSVEHGSNRRTRDAWTDRAAGAMRVTRLTLATSAIRVGSQDSCFAVDTGLAPLPGWNSSAKSPGPTVRTVHAIRYVARHVTPRTRRYGTQSHNRTSSAAIAVPQTGWAPVGRSTS
jgi:hypothetical protein